MRHLIGTASAWGGNPEKDAIYLNVTPTAERRQDRLRAHVKDVPVDGFWSISVYNAEGYFEKNAHNAYTLNNVTAKKSADGSVTVQFGGCDGKIAELPADHAGLELHGAALPSARRNPQRHLEVPGGAAGQLTATSERRIGQLRTCRALVHECNSPGGPRPGASRLPSPPWDRAEIRTLLDGREVP